MTVAFDWKADVKGDPELGRQFHEAAAHALRRLAVLFGYSDRVPKHSHGNGADSVSIRLPRLYVRIRHADLVAPGRGVLVREACEERNDPTGVGYPDTWYPVDNLSDMTMLASKILDSFDALNDFRNIKLPDPAEFARLLALWAARTVGANVAGALDMPEAKALLAGLQDSATVDEIGNAVLLLPTEFEHVAGVRSHAVLNVARVVRAAAAVLKFPRLPQLADDAAKAAYALVVPSGQFGVALVDAWARAGGDVAPLRKPGVNQQLVELADIDGLDMSAWHCGTSHCIAGWYSTLTGHPKIERSFSCALAAWLMFAVNNPGEDFPYMGDDQERGEEELLRLAELNPVKPTSEMVED